MSEKLLTFEDLCEMFKYSRSTMIDLLKKEPTFPKPLRFSTSSKNSRRIWRESMISEWLNTQEDK